jgi:hypothetical protein
MDIHGITHGFIRSNVCTFSIEKNLFDIIRDADNLKKRLIEVVPEFSAPEYKLQIFTI